MMDPIQSSYQLHNIIIVVVVKTNNSNSIVISGQRGGQKARLFEVLPHTDKDGDHHSIPNSMDATDLGFELCSSASLTIGFRHENRLERRQGLIAAKSAVHHAVVPILYTGRDEAEAACCGSRRGNGSVGHNPCWDWSISVVRIRGWRTKQLDSERRDKCRVW